MNLTNNNQYRCITLIARNHGIEALKCLLSNSQYKIIAVFTHKLNPLSYDPERKIRSDFHEFENLTKLHKIPLFTIEQKNDLIKLENFAQNNDYDFLISISWRYLISPSVFKKAKIGSFNIHRGDLPKYAGVEPIKNALSNHEKEIAICSHNITENFDEGEIFCKIIHPSNYNEANTLDENVERLKQEIIPHFSSLTIRSLELLLKEKNHGKK